MRTLNYNCKDITKLKMFHLQYNFFIKFLIGISLLPILVAAKFCDGGHICSLPRECCTQGCCPPYQNMPRHLPPAADHVLNLFFINHWYFWCVVVAIILAILCIYSIWRKRFQLCSWRFSEHNTQSEGDSAGSCYAPPQYSRCNSFHHPPPPYTEVTSKPDLYPIVFTCNSENSKNGASYLMVQYFRNYIVRPPGSLSATSTVDSLSSSFMCNATDANNLVPPPYSRVASPDIDLNNSNIQQQFIVPRSASQLIYTDDRQQSQQTRNNNIQNTQKVTNSNSHNQLIDEVATQTHSLRTNDILKSIPNIPSSSNNFNKSNIVISSSEQQFQYISNSNHSFGDIFVDNTCNNNDLNSSDFISTNVLKRQDNNRFHKNHNNQFIDNSPTYKSCNSIGDTSLKIPAANNKECNNYHDLNVLRQSLETCCQLLQQQHQQQQQQQPSILSCNNHSFTNGLINQSSTNDIQSNFVGTSTYSAVSSLANDSPSSPPQATSPTSGEIKIVNQIRQLKFDSNDDSYDTDKISSPSPSRPVTLQTKKKFFMKPNKGLYIQIPNTKLIRSPVNTTNLFAKNRTKRNWTSRSAPTTPGSLMPAYCLGDDRPLLKEEHDENEEDNEQTA